MRACNALASSRSWHGFNGGGAGRKRYSLKTIPLFRTHKAAAAFDTYTTQQDLRKLINM